LNLNKVIGSQLCLVSVQIEQQDVQNFNLLLIE
jgi:hypothetical protein